MKGSLTYCLILNIEKEIGKFEEHIIKPLKSSPNYKEYFPTYKIIKETTYLIDEVNVKFKLKSFSESDLVIEAKIEFGEKHKIKDLLKIKEALYQECKKLSEEYKPSALYEEYTFICIKDYENVEKFVKKNSDKIISLLKRETEKLSKDEINETINNDIKYGTDDNTMIDWDGAFLMNKKGDFRDVITLLQEANIQLLRYRIMDQKLEQEIDKIKELTEKRKAALFFILSRQMRSIIHIRIDYLTQLENATNSIKLFGDWYDAKVYNLASKKLYLQKWKLNVQDKLNILKEIYEMIAHRTTETYTLVLEFTVMILILIEILIFL